MTEDVAVADSVFAPFRKHFDNRSIVELSVLIGTYNMHTRVLQALEIDLEKAELIQRLFTAEPVKHFGHQSTHRTSLQTSLPSR